MNGIFKKTWRVLLIASMIAVPYHVQANIGLVEVYRLALQHDAQLAQAKASYQANLENVDIAKSPLLPQITASGSYTINDGNSNAADVSTTSLGLNLQQSLYQRDYWLRYEQSKSKLTLASYDFKIAQQDMIIRVAERYLNVLLAKEDLSLSQAQEKANQNQWQRAKVSAEIGLASQTDVLQTKSSYDLSKSSRINAENNLDVAYEKLNKLTGTRVTNLKVISTNYKAGSKPLDIQAYQIKAAKHNLSLLKLKQQAEIAEQEIAVQGSGHFPKFYLQANYTDKSYSNFGSAYSGSYQDKNNFNVGVYTSVPLYSGGGTSAKVSQARANANAAKIAMRDAKETAELNARIAVRNIQSGKKLVSANLAAIKSNDAFLNTAQESYEVGLKDLLDVLTARANKFQAQRNLTSSLHNLALSQLRLAQAVGNLTIENLNALEKHLH